MKTLTTIILTIIALILLAGCQTEPSHTKPYDPPATDGTPADADQEEYREVSFDFNNEITSTAFESEEAYITFIKSIEGSSYGPYHTRGFVAEEFAADVTESVAATSKASGASGPAAQNDFSETNVQVQGIDEADIIKTDGNYIYTITNQVLYIIKAYPGEDATIISTVNLEDYPTGIFIQDDRLAIFGNKETAYEKVNRALWHGMSFFTIYDISDKEDPTVVKEYGFEGNYFRGRMKGDHAYFITSTRPEYYPGHPLPIWLEDGVVRSIAVDDILRYDIDYQDPISVNIHAINLKDNDVASKSIFVEGSQNMYMSHENIYFTYTQWVNEWEIEQKITMQLIDPQLSKYEKTLIKKIQETDSDVLNSHEKKNKIWNVYSFHMNTLPQEEQDDLRDEIKKQTKKTIESFEHLEWTVINKVSYDEDDIDPVANGKVPGSINNQFSLDEKDDVLRIATTLNRRWDRWGQGSTESSNNVLTLDKDLNILDALTGIAKTETIFSTRFIDDRLYMVTFRQVDPFFVIDLSNPNNIQELGELKIPGFSRYLHPYDEDTIIGIGQDATDEGRTTGLKISLFDVSDVTNPKEIANYIGEDRYAQSSALWEHKAFLFDKEKELLVIPVYNYAYNKESESYNGAFVFHIESDEIELRGLIDHSEGTDNYWSPAVERSLYIEELLYTKSPYLLRINNIDDLSKVKNIKLTGALDEVNGIPIY